MCDPHSTYRKQLLSHAKQLVTPVKSDKLGQAMTSICKNAKRHLQKGGKDFRLQKVYNCPEDLTNLVYNFYVQSSRDFLRDSKRMN